MKIEGAPTRVMELYYSIAELCFFLRFSDTTIRGKVKGGLFSPPGPDGKPDLSNILNIGGDIRIPASGVNFFLDNHRFVYDAGIKARNEGELRRKLKRGVQINGEEAAA